MTDHEFRASPCRLGLYFFFSSLLCICGLTAIPNFAWSQEVSFKTKTGTNTTTSERPPHSLALEQTDSESYVAKFALSFASYTGLSPQRLFAIADKTFLAKPSMLEQWGIINTTAAASYNSRLNTIVLQPHLVISNRLFHLQIRSLDDLKANPNWNPYEVGQIFHELSHAEYEHFISAQATPADQRLHQIFEREVIPWIKLNFPDLSSTEAETAAWELHGYYRHEAINSIFAIRDQIILENGLNLSSHRCYLTQSLIKAVRNGGDLMDIFILSHDPDEPIADEVQVKNVFVKDQNVDFATAPVSPYRKTWDHELWTQLSEIYNPPQTWGDIAKLVKQDPEVTHLVQTCRPKLKSTYQFLWTPKKKPNRFHFF